MTATFTDDLLEVIADVTDRSDRSLYSAERKLGVSDIGHCHEYVRRILINEEFSDDTGTKWPAFVGTAVGDLVEQAYVKKFEGALAQQTITVPLEVDVYAINLVGHPDIIDTPRDRLIELKTKDGLGVVRRNYIKNNLFQAMLYAKGCIAAGLLTEDCTIQLVYLDRSGAEATPVVYEFTYDEVIIAEAEAWLGDVLYAVANGEQAERDQPRNFCERYCPYFTNCRSQDTDVEGLIRDEETLQAVELLLDARERAKAAEMDKKAATAILADVAGHTATHTVRSTWVNPTEYTTKRAGYSRVDVRKRK